MWGVVARFNETWWCSSVEAVLIPIKKIEYNPSLGSHVLIGYYVPKSDGEFYQFCYVTHAGDIRGASTPFQFRSSTPTEELLTVTEDDSNSDILVVTTKTGLLEVHHMTPKWSTS